MGPDYEVVALGQTFGLPTFRQMVAFARELQRKGIHVTRCQARLGASLTYFKRAAWEVAAPNQERNSP